ncbi:MAG: hypothetical protein AAF667_08205 [Pseudomonadota bacterium]
MTLKSANEDNLKNTACVDSFLSLEPRRFEFGSAEVAIGSKKACRPVKNRVLTFMSFLP